ncbi:MAG: aminoglycoside phosphotransferase, partial [Clostridia bacterium]
METSKVIAMRKTKVIYREGDTVVKLFDANYSKADILNEALNQARVEETAIRIPKLLEVKKIDNRWAIVIE